GRSRVLDYQRGRLQLPAQAEVRTHLNGCADCTRADAVEQELTSVLEHRLPQHPASLALRRRLAAEWPASATERSWWSRWKPSLVPAVAAAAVVLVAAPVLYYERAASRVASERAGMVAEAVNDHLRVLSSQHPLDIESGGLHQVKPWFEGRLDFAPVVPFEGDADVSLYYEAAGRGAPLVLVHGFACGIRSWDPQVRALSLHRRVLTYDVRGHGLSEAPPEAEAYSQATLVADLHALLTHLKIGRAVVGGLSMGGNIALNFALAHPAM